MTRMWVILCLFWFCLSEEVFQCFMSCTRAGISKYRAVQVSKDNYMVWIPVFHDNLVHQIYSFLIFWGWMSFFYTREIYIRGIYTDRYYSKSTIWMFSFALLIFLSSRLLLSSLEGVGAMDLHRRFSWLTTWIQGRCWFIWSVQNCNANFLGLPVCKKFSSF